MKHLTEEQQAEIGREWAKILYLKKHRDNQWHIVKDSWQTKRGWKTSLGLYRTICRMVDDARGESDET